MHDGAKNEQLRERIRMSDQEIRELLKAIRTEKCPDYEAIVDKLDKQNLRYMGSVLGRILPKQ
jgi:hypothetical protein